MKVKTMDKLTAHFDRYFEQSDCMVIHPIVDNGFHIDILLYKPTEKYPFWKLATMGASDFKMPAIQNTLGMFNEYIMFVDKDENLENREVASWYHRKLTMIAAYPKYCNIHITYGHSLEWENEDSDDEMIAAFLEFPQVIEDTGVLHCKTGLLKTVTCLQVVLLNKNELKMLGEIGPQNFSEYLYPEDGRESHFLSERHRSEKF
ncbi:MAG: suppressor of fused domain protein [Acutalibacteraceae bacterium]